MFCGIRDGGGCFPSLSHSLAGFSASYSGIACTPSTLAMVAMMVPTIFKISFQVSLLIFIIPCFKDDCFKILYLPRSTDTASPTPAAPPSRPRPNPDSGRGGRRHGHSGTASAAGVPAAGVPNAAPGCGYLSDSPWHPVRLRSRCRPNTCCDRGNAHRVVPGNGFRARYRLSGYSSDSPSCGSRDGGALPPDTSRDSGV